MNEEDVFHTSSSNEFNHHRNTINHQSSYLRPVAQRSSQLQRNLAHNPNYRCNTSKSISPSNNTKSEPDLLDAKYTEFRRPWYANPEYKGPRRIPFHSANSPHGSTHTLPRSNQFYDYTIDDNSSSVYSNPYRSPRDIKAKHKSLRNQSSINTTSEPYDPPHYHVASSSDTTRQSSSAFHSFENLMNLESTSPHTQPNYVIQSSIGPSTTTPAVITSSSPDSFSSSSNHGQHQPRRQNTIKPRRRRAPRSYESSNEPRQQQAPPSQQSQQYQEEFIRPVDYSARNNMTSPSLTKQKTYLEVKTNNRASSLPRSDFSDIDENPRRSVGSDGLESAKSSISSPYYPGHIPHKADSSSSPVSPLMQLSHPVIDENTILKYLHRPSIQSNTTSSMSFNEENPNVNYSPSAQSGGHPGNKPLGSSSNTNKKFVFPCRVNKAVVGSQQAWNEALFHVFALLDTRSLARCGAVNKLWYAISRQPVLWQRLRLRNVFLSAHTLIRMCRWCTDLRELSLERVKVSSPSALQIITSASASSAAPTTHLDKDLVGNQHTNDLNKIEASLVRILDTNKDSLKTIRIVDCGEVVTCRVLWSASIYCARLTKLIYISKQHPLGQAELYPLGRGCPKINTLIIPPGWPCAQPDKFNDLCCETVSRCWTHLQVLCIGGRRLTAIGLCHIAKQCIKLQRLEIIYGPEVTEDTATNMVKYGLRGLIKLDFTFTPVSPRAVVLFSTACVNISKISIHCNIKDYFTNYNSTKAKSDYNSLKTLFRRLKMRPGFTNVLDIDLDYEDVSTSTTSS